MRPETVVATVAGQPITEADLSFAAEDLTQELSQMPPEQRKPFLLRVLIDMKVMAAAGRAEGMAETPLFQQRLAYLEDRALRRAYFAETIAAGVTEAAVRAEYDKLVADFKPTEEIRASHILVPTEDEAKAVKAELDGGADFATLAKEKSIDPGAANGGDLGFFGPGQMVPPFEKAAYALELGTYTKVPVETQFGWHVIQVTEKRPQPQPSFDDVKEQVRQVLMREKYMAIVQKARDELKVEYVDPAVKTAVEAMEKSMANGGPAPGEAAPAGTAPADGAAPAEAPATAPAPAQ